MSSRTACWVAALAALVLDAGCSCGGDVLLDGGSSIAVDTPVLDFGRVFIGSEARRTFILSAPGDIPVDYGTDLTGEVFGYQIGPAFGQMPANGAVEIVVLFRPGRIGPHEANARFFSNATRTTTAAVVLRAQGALPPDCEDGNGCTEDTFDIEAARCVHKAVPVLCDDFDMCTVSDSCADGVCLGVQRSCDDSNPCTDDFCDPTEGCLNLPTQSCDDGNPCTADSCGPGGECRNTRLDDGAPCDDGFQCTTADICLMGSCKGVNVPDGTMCDDGEPCSKDDQCIEGECQDPNYEPPGPGEIKFETATATLTADAGTNPIIDRDSTVFLGVLGGVTAVDQCGEILWTNDTLGTPRWSAALALPGRLSVPVGSRVITVDPMTGGVLGSVDVAEAFGGPPVGTSSTVRILDLAARASGALVASVVHQPFGPIHGRNGAIIEIDRTHRIATSFIDLGPLHASRIAVDRDESVLAVLADGFPDLGPRNERLARFGGGDDATSGATTATVSVRTELAIDRDGRALWTHGLVAVTRAGRPKEIGHLVGLAPTGSPVVGPRGIVWLRALPFAPVPGPGIAPSSGFELVVTSTAGHTSWRVDLAASAEQMSPVLDLFGNIFLLTWDSHLTARRPDGAIAFELDLEFPTDRMSPTGLAINHDGVVIVPGPDRLVGVQAFGPQGVGAWPRHRRDNLSTGHR